jgi:hypothetical protein
VERRAGTGPLGIDEDEAEPDGEGDPEGNLAASAVSGQTPPAGPQWVSRLAPLEPHALIYDKPLCASLDGSPCTRRRGRALSTRRAGRLSPKGAADCSAQTPRPRGPTTFRRNSIVCDLSYFAGVYQIGELQARSWMVAGTLVSGAMFSRAAS